MHIAFNGWFWNQPYTGSGQYVRQLVAELARLRKERQPGFDLSLIVPVNKQRPLPADVPAGVTVIPVKTGPGQVGKVWFEQSGYPAAVKKCKADVAHVPYWGGPLNSPARLVITVHDVIPLSMPVYMGGIGARLYFSLVTATAKGAGHIITDSEFSKQEIMAHMGLPSDMVTAIPLAADSAFHPRIGAEGDEAIRAKYNLPESGYTLYLGGFDVRKNLEALLAAYTYVGPSVGEEYPLVLAGREPSEWGSARFPNLHGIIANSPGLAQWVRWLGAIDEADKPGLYRMARAFVFPSRYEGFGLGVLEAMASGTPVVASNASSVPEVAGESAYLVSPDDSRKMGGAIIAVLIQDNLHDSLASNGLARASAYSWNRTARETLAVYEALLAKKA
jgi:glycosyltransferase involved in cell wall biosynthesis